MLDLTKPVQTRDGRKVRILCTDRKNPIDGSVVGLVEDNFGEEWVGSWTLDGKAWPASATGADLVNAPEKLVVYVCCNDDSPKKQYTEFARSEPTPTQHPSHVLGTIEISVRDNGFLDVVIRKK